MFTSLQEIFIRDVCYCWMGRATRLMSRECKMHKLQSHKTFSSNESFFFFLWDGFVIKDIAIFTQTVVHHFKYSLVKGRDCQACFIPSGNAEIFNLKIKFVEPARWKVDFDSLIYLI